MGSNRKVTKTKRQAKRHKQGKSRKRKLRRDGTTPSFPLDPPK